MYSHLKRHLRADFATDDEVLHACIRDGDIPKLRQLLEPAHASLNYIHPSWGAPLHYAAVCGDLDATELLLAAGADLFLTGYEGLRLTAIGCAAREGHQDVVRRLWAAATPEDQLRNVEPCRASLVVASTYGRAAIVHDLLTRWHGWPQELKDNALLWAARRWHFEVADLLLNAAEFEQSKLQEALRFATEKKVTMEDEFKSKCEGFEYLNQQSLIALLVDAGSDPNYSWNNIPLLCSTAVNANLTGALKVLLEKGADPNVTSQTGRSALHIVAGTVSQDQLDRPVVNEAAMQLLLRHKGSISQPDEVGETPLHKAAFGLDLRLFQLYLSSCRDQEEQKTLLFSKTHHAETLLHFAAAGCCVETIEFLISRGLDVNAKNSNGWTPLICALVPIDGGSLRTRMLTKLPDHAIRAARCLLSHGADAAIYTEEGWTALHCLALYCDYDFCDRTNTFASELLSNGVNPHARAVLLRKVSPVVPSVGMPWGCRLNEAIRNPEAAKIVAGPNLSALSWAAERGALGVLKALLAYGVDASSMNGVESSPTRLAVESQYLKGQPKLADRIVKLLLEAGAGF